MLIGTADKGRTYSVTDDARDTLLLQSSEGQISAFITRPGEVLAASSNQGKLFRFGNEVVNEGTYESPVRDAKLVASWGRIWWRGRGQIDLETRSGLSERPDTTWSDWSATYSDRPAQRSAVPKRDSFNGAPSVRGQQNATAARTSAGRRQRRLHATQRRARSAGDNCATGRRRLATVNSDQADPDELNRPGLDPSVVWTMVAMCRRGDFTKEGPAQFNGRRRIATATPLSIQSITAR